MSEQKGRCGQICILATSFILLICGFALCTTGLVSPSWQVVDIREFRAEHHVRSFRILEIQFLAWFMARLHKGRTTGCHSCSSVQRLFTHALYLQIWLLSKSSRSFLYVCQFLQVIDENIEDIDQNSAAGESEHHQFFGNWYLLNFRRTI